MHFLGVILVKLTIPVSEKRDFDEKRDFLEGEKGRLGWKIANVSRGMVKNGFELEK
jgi:hypothetical protein